MKNLKKVLSLVMAFTMSLSMMASATFTDSADIKSKEAVDLLSALGVIKGNTDGTFAPDKVVTRAEMAKMVYVIKNGGREDATAFSGAATTFTDINGHWAANYIKYAYTSGIIAGKSTKSFAPDAPVTGQEAAKMVLVLLGYDAEKAGLVGNQWAIKTTALATEKGIFDNYEISISEGAPRQYAAQLLSNGLSARVVMFKDGGYQEEYSQITTSGTDGTQLNYVTLGEKAMGLKTHTATFAGNNKFGGNKSEKGTIKLTSTSTANTVINKDASYTMPNNLDWIGEEVRVLYKETSESTDKTGLDKGDKVYGVTNPGKTKVVKTTSGELQDSAVGKIKVADVENSALANLNVYSNYRDTVESIKVEEFDLKKADATAGKQATKSSDSIKFVADANGNLATAYITKVNFGRVSSVNSDSINIQGIGPVKLADHKVATGLAKDDIVSYTTYYSSDNASTDAYFVIEKANIVTETLTAVRERNEIKLGSGEYLIPSIQTASVGNSFGIKASDSLANPSLFTNAQIGKTLKVITNGKYWIAAEESTETSKDVAVVLGAEESDFSGNWVKLLLANGTEAKYQMHKDSTVKVADATVGKMFAYSVTSDNKVKLSSDTSTMKHGTTATYDSNNKTLTLGADKYIATSTAVAFVKSPKTAGGTKEWQVIKLNDLGNFTNTGSTSVSVQLDSNNRLLSVTVELDTKPSGVKDSSSYGIITDKAYAESENGTVFTKVGVWNGKENTVLKLEGNSSGETKLNKGTLVKYDVSSNGITDIANVEKISTDLNTDKNATVKAVRTKGVQGDIILVTEINNVNVDTNTAYKLSKDVKIIFIDAKNDKGVEGEQEIGSYDEVTKAKNAVLIFDKNPTDPTAQVTTVFYDISNDIAK